MNEEIQIIIADDHPIFRRGLRGIIEGQPDLNVVAEADNGETALSLIKEHEPDVVVLDVDMPGKDGFETVKSIMKQDLGVGVIFLTMHNSESIFNAALDLGVKGYVLKDSALPEITDSIRAVAAGKNYISPPLSTYLVNRAGRAESLNAQTPGISGLTAAERNILKLIAAEKTSRQIADELFISIRTVDRHRANISSKLDLRGTNALVKFALVHRSEL
ncbi:MAG TPA: response regulator transcription factor [Pyrinomonadaceae bacterium]|jgi:DNA-binding NarL/FixJ family response regulator|nr:response regulator transcription factor [Pyrinomonadaceae bacterium]